MKLYNSYCYTDINAVSISIGSNFFIGGGQVLTSVSVLNSDQLSISTQSPDGTNAYTITVPDCTREGFDNTYFGVSVSDAYDMWMMSAVVLATVYYIKILKRAA
jgi:hypothetical protein